MLLLATILTGFVAFQHISFMILEMFFWTKPSGLKIFRMNLETAMSSAVLAKNQGLYNGFLAAGLIWSIMTPNPQLSISLRIFFLTCVIIAGIYGSLTASRSIFFIQALPAIVTIFVTLL